MSDKHVSPADPGTEFEDYGPKATVKLANIDRIIETTLIWTFAVAPIPLAIIALLVFVSRVANF